MLTSTPMLSPHLSLAELACKDGTAYPQAFIDEGRAATLAALFEQARTLLGDQPLAVLSAYRTPQHNTRIGGAPNSQHVQGRALDLRPPAGMTPTQMFNRLMTAKAAGTIPSLGGLGHYKTFTHIDTRPVPKGRTLIVWNGGAQMKDDRG